MSTAEDVKFHLKVVINKQKTKVLYAEADSDFADMLLSFLAMPLGQVVRLMNKHYGDKAPVLGSLTTLYNGVANLDSAYFCSGGAQQMLLNPRSWFDDVGGKLKHYMSGNHPVKYFICGCKDPLQSNVGIYYGTARCSCGRVLDREVKQEEIHTAAKCSDVVLSVNAASFIICDDMQIAPNVIGSIMETLSSLEITDTDDAELLNVALGLNEIMDLLKGMFVSRTPLTDLILNNKQNDNMKLEPGILLDRIEKEAASSSKKMILKVMVQKSTNKLLFAQAEEDFVDFLFGLLTIPLGGVEYLLDNNTHLQSIDNFYNSFASINGDKYLQTKDAKSMLLNPKLPPGYTTKGQFLPLIEEPPSFIQFKRGYTYVSQYKSPKSDANYVIGSRNYMVTDDLTVTPLCLSHLHGLNLPLSDVAELKLDIGLEEALSILKASLSSTSALTNGLPLLKKSVKQEQ